MDVTIPVVWFGSHILCWDQAMLDELLKGQLWAAGHDFEHYVDEVPVGGGAVLVVPARYHKAADIQQVIDRLEWAVVLLTSDEESTFPWRELTGNIAVWVMTPRPHLHAGHDRMLGEYWPTDTRTALLHYKDTAADRPLDWFFAGQVTHPRRRACVNNIRHIPGGELVETPGFTKGLERAAYLLKMASAKVAPCPSGPATPDSFRLYEALEAGCFPIVDNRCPAYGDGYWPLLLAGDIPFPLVDDWTRAPDLIKVALDEWPHNANRTFAWWQRYKRDLHHRINDDVTRLSGVKPDEGPVTILMPTSPIPSHPSTHIIEETIDSVRHHFPTAEIVIMCDGVRVEQGERRAAYGEYLRKLLWLTNYEWSNVTPLVFPTHQHQANMTRAALDLVRTDHVLFVEHDTPLVTDEPIDWPAVFHALDGSHLDVVRFHYEAFIPDPHWPLMRDREPILLDGLPVYRTKQWSQRPHVARTSYYRKIIAEHFFETGRTMIEDVMHSVAQVRPLEHRIGIYAPGPNIKRSLNLDGREDDIKYDMVYR